MTSPDPSSSPAGTLPPTLRLDWSRPQDRRFTAHVTAVDGRRVALDQTLFYPEGGGQAADQGWLGWAGGRARVGDVQKAGGVVWHALETAAPLPSPGQAVEGELDWTLRYRHSQRHTAEHLLAQAFFRLNPAFAVQSVSMRGPQCTLDLGGRPDLSQALAAQTLLMERFRDDLTLETLTVGAGDLGAYPLRRPPQVSGEVRLVLFRDPAGEIWEASACGGSHLPRASLAAPVVVTRVESVKGGLTRVTFMAGEEATARLSESYLAQQELARQFSTSPEGLPARIEGLRREAQQGQSEAEGARRQLAAGLLDAAPWQPLGPGRFALLDLADPALLRPLLAEGLDRPDTLVGVTAADGRCGFASTLAAFPAAEVLRQALDASGGRGGGRADLAQGQTPDPAAFRRAALSWYADRHEDSEVQRP